MKICIWCNENEAKATFEKKAHTFPQSMGGKSICENVCDSCNHYFGAPLSRFPAIEVVLKEILNLSKYLLLYTTNESPKKDTLNAKFDFIREFARYDLGDYLVYCFTPKFNMIFFSLPDINSPTKYYL